MVLAIKWIAISSWTYSYCHYYIDDWPKITFGLRVIRVMVNVKLCIDEECYLVCGVWKILLLNVNVIYLCCFNFVGVFEPFFQGQSFNFVCVTEPFLFQFCLQFEYQLHIVGTAHCGPELDWKIKWLHTSTYYFLYRIKSITYSISLQRIY